MLQHRAALATCLEEMKRNQKELQDEIEKLEEERDNLSSRLKQLNDTLEEKKSVRTEYEKTIADAETALLKI